MSRKNREQLIRLVRRSDLAEHVMGFLIDREERGLSHRTIQFYNDELRYHQGYFREKAVRDANDVTPTPLRQYLLHLSAIRNPGGTHTAYGAMRAFFRRCEAETEVERNPISKVRPPKVTASRWSRYLLIVSRPCWPPVNEGHSLVIKTER